MIPNVTRTGAESFLRKLPHLSMASDSSTAMAKRSFLICCLTRSSWAIVHLGDGRRTSHETNQLEKKTLQHLTLTTPPSEAASPPLTGTCRSLSGNTCPATASTEGNRRIKNYLRCNILPRHYFELKAINVFTRESVFGFNITN